MTSANEAERKKYLKTTIKQIDLEKTTSIRDLVTAFSGASIQARNIGQCAEI
jgi:deoxyhypusine synthase